MRRNIKEENYINTNKFNFKKQMILLLIFIVIVFITIYYTINLNNNNNNNQNENNNIDVYVDENIEIDHVVENKYTDNNPLNIGLYIKKDTYFELVESYTNSWKAENVIGQFYIFPTQEKKIYQTNYKKIWDEYIKKYENFDNSIIKTGFNINFVLSTGEVINRNILTPDDAYLMFPKVMFFLYDDYNYISTKRYYHVTNETLDSVTFLTSAKLVGDVESKNIVSSITLTAFSYDTDDDFDDNNNYIGNSKYSILIYKK